MRSRPPAQQRALSTGKDGGQVGGVEAGRAVADAVYASVRGDQRAPLQPRGDLMACHAGTEELRPRNHPVCRAGDSGQFFVDCPA